MLRVAVFTAPKAAPLPIIGVLHQLGTQAFGVHFNVADMKKVSGTVF